MEEEKQKEEEETPLNPQEASNDANDSDTDIHSENQLKGKRINPLAILSYIGILVFIPWLMAKNDKFVMFHVKQGITLFIAEVITWGISFIPVVGTIIAIIFNIIWLVFSVIGIINTLEGEKKELPYIGQYAHNWKI